MAGVSTTVPEALSVGEVPSVGAADGAVADCPAHREQNINKGRMRVLVILTGNFSSSHQIKLVALCISEWNETGKSGNS
jgi:hypothetical protein